MDMKKYRMNQAKDAEPEYLGQPYRNNAELPEGATISSPVQKTMTPAQIRKSAYVRIVEQPAPKSLRFRYKCEGRSAGSIPGANSTPEYKTFPTIQIVGYKGRALVIVSCVSKDKPYRPHPHNLVGKDWCTKGVCSAKVEEASDMTVTFNNLGIQCVTRKEILPSLQLREDVNVDPFRTGFAHACEPSSIDLNVVRLCFQVIIEGETPGKFTIPLRPVVSDPIYDKKSTSELVICELSQCTASAAGGQKIILLCEKVNKEDITIRFFEERDGLLYWEDYGFFKHSNVHKQTAISFITPPYKNQDIEKPVKAFIQLRQPSSGAVSEPLAFQFAPINIDTNQPASKKARLATDTGHLLKHLQKQGDENNLNIKNNKMMNIPVDAKPDPHPIYQEPLNLGRNEAPGPSSFYRDWRTVEPTSHYPYPSPYDITHCNRYPVLAAPYTPSISHGRQYQWRTTDNLDILKNRQYSNNQHQIMDTALNVPQNPSMSQYHQQQQSDFYYHQHHETYKHLANGYRQDLKKELQPRPIQPNQPRDGPAINPFQEYAMRNDDVRHQEISNYQHDAGFFNENDVPKISKLLNEPIPTVHKSTTRKQNDFKSAPTYSNGVQNENTNTNFNSLMNTDSQQLAQLNSTDLIGLSGFLEPSGAPNEKTVADKLAEEHESMTDSFTKMSTSEIEDLTVGNNFNNI